MIQLDPGEHILLEVRKHWFVFLAQGLAHFVAAVAPFFLYEAIKRLVQIDIPVAGNGMGLIVFLYALYLLLVWVSFFLQWTYYYLDVWYITEKRIIDVEQKAFFHRSISSLRFDKIQDVTIEVRGVVATFFDIGNIRVQTAAEDSRDFFMRQAASPEKVRNFIFSQHNKVVEDRHHLYHATDRDSGI